MMKRFSGSSSPIECRPLTNVSSLAARGSLGAFALDARERRRAHARHDAHVRDDVRAVGDLDAAARNRRIDRAHAIRNHVHRAAAHRAGEQRIDLRVRLGRIHPVVVRAGVVLVLRADERQVLDARDIGRIRAMQPAVRMRLGVERDQRAVALHRSRSAAAFSSSEPSHQWTASGCGKSGDFVDPSVQRLELAGHWRSGALGQRRERRDASDVSGGR